MATRTAALHTAGSPDRSGDAVTALSPGELVRYSRHLLLPEVGLAGQERLSAARVLLVGASLTSAMRDFTFTGQRMGCMQRWQTTSGCVWTCRSATACPSWREKRTLPTASPSVPDNS